ncbi:hypothetical protein [Nibribacter koreensis]|uniref:Uncharacterized protein n=1 Tax=Nibribacter koreensis TaxID=1084519 RepID=A0ABP8FUP4_9BACT
MKGKIVRACAWFALIIFSLTSLAGLLMMFTEGISWAGTIAIGMCFLMAVTGGHARKYGLPEFKAQEFSKLSAVVSLVFGVLFIIFMPLLFMAGAGFEDSFVAIRNLLILFLPVVISAIAILASKGKTE